MRAQFLVLWQKGEALSMDRGFSVGEYVIMLMGRIPEKTSRGQKEAAIL